MDRDKILLTPGPLTTTLRTKLAMLRDWGSWDSDFNEVTVRVRRSLLQIIHGEDSHVVVPLQGSGTFSSWMLRLCAMYSPRWMFSDITRRM